MAMTLRLTPLEHDALRECAEAEGVSMHAVARKAICEYVFRTSHINKVSAATDVILAAHSDALDRLSK